MNNVKDIFSQQAAGYAQYRPSTPQELYDHLLGLVKGFDMAWDCGTGNGQAAIVLAGHFKTVYATDISKKQLDNAVQAPNIIYKLERAEQTSLPADSVDLITVAQAIHWFDFGPFYSEVQRVAKDGAIIAAWTYILLQVDNGPIDEIVNNIYVDILGPYWDKERKYVDERYQTIPFPFEELEVPVCYNRVSWTAEQLKGYLNTWSSAGHFKAKHGHSPVDLIAEQLEKHWKSNELKEVIFPIFMRIGRIVK